jgi:hypothetical protein
MQHRKQSQAENDIESVALGTLLTGMRKLYWETEAYMRDRIEEVERRYQQLVGAAKVAARHEVVDEEQPVRNGVAGRANKRAGGALAGQPIRRSVSARLSVA